MASETRCTITVDKEHVPPRWVQAQGLRIFDLWDPSKSNTPKLFGAAILVPAILLFAFARPWFSTIPPWALILITVASVTVLGFALALRVRVRVLANRDAQDLSTAPEGGTQTHRDAILAAFYSGGRRAPLVPRRFSTESIWDLYKGRGMKSPVVLIHGDLPSDTWKSNPEYPQHIKGDPLSKFRLSKRMKILLWAPFILTLFLILPVLWLTSPQTNNWPITGVLIIFLLSPFVGTAQMNLIAPKRSVIIDRGVVEFSKRFQKYRLTNNESLCMIVITTNRVFVEWHLPFKRWPSLTLCLRDPDDPRLATILNLWTADPLPDNSV